MKRKPNPNKKNALGKALKKTPTGVISRKQKNQQQPQKKIAFASKAKPEPEDHLTPLYFDPNFLLWSDLYRNPPAIGTLAMVAATIYKREPMSPRQAVGVALSIIDESIKAVRVIDSIDEDLTRKEKSKQARHFSYSEGVKEITKQKRKDRAVAEFQDILVAKIKASHGGGEFIDPYIGHLPTTPDERLRKMLSDQISNYEKQGFTGWEITMLQAFSKKLKKNI